jgi:ABC-type uncharacterized transport system involved in gliding motility auxiliary subunit
MRQQMIRYTAAGTVGLILAIALTLMVNWLAARHWKLADWTSSQVYTLSEKTENVLAQLEEEIRVVVFMTPASELYDQVSVLLKRYAAASSKVKVETIDPDKEPLKTRQLAEQFGISVADTVVFTYADRTKYITSDQMAEMDYSGMQYGQAPTVTAFKGEERFTSAILSLVAPQVPKVYLVTGHGEARMSPSGGGLADRGVSVLEESLRRENMEVEELSLLSGMTPEDADVMAILGPTEPYTEAEIAALETYLEGGGRLLVCLDPLISADASMRTTRLEQFLANHGIRVNNDLVVDPSQRLPFFDLSAVYLQDFNPHPITTGLEGVAALFPVTRSLAADSGVDSGVQILVETSTDGWGETNLAQLLQGDPVEADDADTPGPVAVALVAEGAASPADDLLTEGPAENDGDADESTENGFRLVAFGDSDFLTDGQIVNAGNLTLALNTFNWLAAREQSLGIPPRAVEQVSLYLSEGQLGFIMLMSLVLMPGAAIVAGIFVWRRRRH